jgi:hypothetical protein
MKALVAVVCVLVLLQCALATPFTTMADRLNRRSEAVTDTDTDVSTETSSTVAGGSSAAAKTDSELDADLEALTKTDASAATSAESQATAESEAKADAELDAMLGATTEAGAEAAAEADKPNKKKNNNKFSPGPVPTTRLTEKPVIVAPTADGAATSAGLGGVFRPKIVSSDQMRRLKTISDQFSSMAKSRGRGGVLQA